MYKTVCSDLSGVSWNSDVAEDSILWGLTQRQLARSYGIPEDATILRNVSNQSTWHHMSEDFSLQYVFNSDYFM